MAWAKNGSTTLSGTSDTITVSSLTASKTNLFLSHTIPSTSTAHDINFNNDTGSNYAHRRSEEGGADVTSTSQTKLDFRRNSNEDHFYLFYVASISGQEKLGIFFNVTHLSNGAGNAPKRSEAVFKYVPSPDADITQVKYNKGSFTNFDTGSNVSVLGSDLTPALEEVTLQDGTIFEETDTNKAYIWNATSQTWTQL